MKFEDMNPLQRRLHNAAIVLDAEGDEHGFVGLLREAIAAEEAKGVWPVKNCCATGYSCGVCCPPRHTPPPADHIGDATKLVAQRPINCGTGHCSCVECVCEPVADDSERAALIAKLRDFPPNPFRLMMWKAADMLAADARRTTHQDQTPIAWRVSLDKGITWTIYETDPSKIHGMDAAIITPLVARHTPPTDWSAA